MSSETPLGSEPPRPRESSLERWERAGLIALAVVVLAIPLSLLRPARTGPGAGAAGGTPAFVGSASCEECHKAAFAKWRGSHHERAMDLASDKTVLGDFADATFTHRGVSSRFYRRGGKFYVYTEGPDGKPGEFEIAYTFGWKPLQQYLVPFPGGRLQCLTIAWDTERKRWFHLYPDQDIPASDWLHWTRNAQNWNGMCAECHSTNLKKGYDAEKEAFNTTWSDINVGCEACHGPGSRHVAWARVPAMARPALADQGLVVPTSGITGAQLVELCAPCHSRRAELGDYDHSGRLLMDHMLPSLLTEGLYFADGQQQDEVYNYASFLQSKMYARGVKCSDCHDSHSLKLKKDGNEVCLQCHVREVFDSSEHHFHKKLVDGKPSEGALCARCHMPKRPYMVVDPRSDHSFRRPRPDLTAEIGTPNACSQSGCHADKPLSYSLNAYRKWYGQARRPHFGTTFAAARAGKPEAAEELLRLVDNTLQPAIVRATALSLLERYPGEASTKVLRRALLSEEPLLRHVAASGLAVPDARERVSLLAPLLADPVKAVRLDAVSALAGVPRELLKPYQREAFDAALAEYRTAMAYSLDFSSSGMNLGNLYTNLGKPAEAEKYYRLALKIDDLFFPAKMNLAVLLSGQGRGAEAEKLLREVVASYPDNGDARYSLGLLLVEVGKADEAVAHMRRAASLMPRNARARYNLGLLLDQLGHGDEAEPFLAGALSLEPANPEFLHALAGFQLKRGRPREALALAERLIAAHPDQRIGHELKALAERALAGAGAAPRSTRAPR
jgi:predicted CXXCH cytochrome family protein